MNSKIILMLSSLIILFSCTRGAETPEGLIKMFAKDVSTKKLDMDYYEKFTTGAMWKQISEMDEEEFQEKTRITNVENVKIKILSKNCENDKCIITYIVTYKTKSSSEKSFSTEVKKIAEVHKSEDKFWKIAKVNNLKTYHESNGPINPITDEAPKKEYSEE